MSKNKTKTATAAKPVQMWARDWRRASYLCAIMDGRAVLAKRVNGEIDLASMVSLPIAGGAWSRVTDLAQWQPVESAGVTLRMMQIHRDCYCLSFPDTGCDFCNGTRLPDGAVSL